MALCNQSTVDKQNYRDNMQKIWNHWIGKRYIADRFTDREGFNAKIAADYMKEFIEQHIEMPWHPDLVLSDATLRRIKVEMDTFDRALNSKFSNFAWMVPEGISKQDPVARKFYLRLNDILNFERVNINKVMTVNGEIANHMFDAYMAEHKISRTEGFFKGDKAMAKLKDLRRQLLDPEATHNTQAAFEREMTKFIEKDKEGVTIKQFHELIHMDAETFKEAKKESYRDEKGQKVTYNSHVYQAVKKARSSLDAMGGVYIRGLGQIKKLIALKYAGTANVKTAKKVSTQAKNLIEKVENSIKDIEVNMKKGGYFPQVEFENMMAIKHKISEAMTSNKMNQNFKFTNLVDSILSKVNISDLPSHVKKRNPTIERYWEKDPLMVLKEYGDQAVQFNKSIFTQISYLEALHAMPKSNSRFMKGMQRFINEEYAVFMHGTSKRAAWANQAVTTINALQTARTMGLNITGAIKNAASAINYYSRVGYTAISSARKAIDNSKGEKDGFAENLRIVEKEAGFLFQEAAKELYTEGLIDKKQFETGEFEFNPLTGKMTVNGNPLRDLIAKSTSFTLDKLLFFHRLTENHQRKWMFRTAFHQKFTELTDQGYDTARAREFSKNFALKMVNGWAYEYAAHAKSKAVRGEFRTVDEMEGGVIARKPEGGVLGAGSEIAFHLLHYPMSLMETQWSTIKGAHKSLLANQGFESSELRTMMRYGGMMSVMGLLSAITNTDLTNIFENETVERLNRVRKDIVEAENPDRGTFGLLSEFTGPTIGMMKYAAIANGIIDTDHDTLNKILFGNVDFADPNDKLSQQYMAYQYSTTWGVLKNKIEPTIRNGRGRDLITHYLKLYPSPWTKAGHEAIWGKKPKKKTGKETDVTRALKALELLQQR